ERHRHPFNFYIHLAGIPCAVAGVVMLFILPWYWGVAAIVLGYALQFAGHQVEGNDVGEWAAIKRMLGMPRVSIAPRWQRPGPAPASTSSQTSSAAPLARIEATASGKTSPA